MRRAKSDVLQKLKGRFITGRLGANVLWAWHGCAPENARQIVDAGFANLSLTDPGWHGSGGYLSLEAEYACAYASNYPGPVQPGRDGWCVILCLVVLGVTYPVTLCAEDFFSVPSMGGAPSPQDCKLYGRPMQRGFDSHVVAVKRYAQDGNFLAAATSQHTEFNELVLDQDGQILPVAVVWFC